MATQILTFDGVDLTPYIGMWSEMANSRINPQTVPRRHGVVLSDAIVEDARYITAMGTIVSPTAQGLRDILDTLGSLFMRQGKQLALWDDRYIVAYKASWQHEFVVGSAMRAATFVIQFICPDPFWYGTTPSDENFDLTTADLALDITNNKYRRSVTINNTSGVIVYPTITVTPGATPLTTVVVRNMTSGRYFQFTATVAVGKTLVVDMANFTIMNGGVSDLTHFNGDFWALQIGNNDIQLEGTAPANYDFLYRTRWK